MAQPAKKVLIISSSPRKNSNSESLALAFADGAKEVGHKVDFICLRDKTINYCKGCFACQKTQKCVIRDDGNAICKKALNADVLVFATPIYYYEMSGQLKTMLDRLNPLFPSDYAFRDVYVLTSAAEDESYTPKKAVSGVVGWIDCYERCTLKGHLFCGGVNDPREISGHAKLQEAYKMGKNV